jgi:DNA-binding response OmpR family regulator
VTTTGALDASAAMRPEAVAGVRADDAVRPGGCDVVSVQGVELDRAARRVRAHGLLFDLPPKEYELLETLMLNAGRALRRDELLNRVWADSPRGQRKTLDAYVLRLRGKIEADPSHPACIRTLRGFGYIFDTEPSGAAAIRLGPGAGR